MSVNNTETKYYLYRNHWYIISTVSWNVLWYAKTTECFKNLNNDVLLFSEIAKLYF